MHPMVQPQSVSLSFSLKRQAFAQRSCANNVTKARRWFDGKASRFKHDYAAPTFSGGLAIRRFRRFEEHRQRHWRMTAAGDARLRLREPGAMQGAMSGIIGTCDRDPVYKDPRVALAHQPKQFAGYVPSYNGRASSRPLTFRY
jgi:hypothetical protein